MSAPSQVHVSSNESEPGKRTLLGMLGAFGLLTVLVVCVSLGAKAMRPKTKDAAPAQAAASATHVHDEIDPQIAAFLGPLAKERRFETWHITRIDPLQFGRLTMELEDDTAARFVVDVHARSTQAPPPVAESTQLAIYLRTNQRGGQTPAAMTNACIALADVFRRREEAGHSPPRLDPLVPR